MKTIKEWLEELPEPYRTQALENKQDLKCRLQSDLHAGRTDNLASAINYAFVWKNTPQGHDYWKALHTEAQETGAVKAPAPAPEKTTIPGRKPFNIEAAKAGKPVVMGDDTPVHRFLAFDFKNSGYPILATILNPHNQEIIHSFTVKGEFNLHGSCSGGDQDLFMAPEKVIKYINVYKKPNGQIYSGASGLNDTEEQAREKQKISAKYSDNDAVFLGTFPVEITL